VRVPELPPPDPHESRAEPGPTGPLARATAVFPFGPTDPETDRLVDRLLDLRPGLLIVLHRP
jgi:hypothetical protein